MALGAALVHRARVIKKIARAEKVDGAKIYDDVSGPWFRCRYTPSTGTESKDDHRARYSKPATLLYGTRALDGTPVLLNAEDSVEIVTVDALPSITMGVDGSPDDISKRTTVIGHTAILQKVSRKSSNPRLD